MEVNVLKKVVGIFWGIFFLLLSFSGCYPSYKTYYTNVSDYSEIFKLQGYILSCYEIKSIFPDSISGLDVKNFYCRYDEQLPLGEGFQVLLEIKYNDKDLFNEEINRISSIAFDCSENFKKCNFKAYATHLLKKGFSEYSLVDNNNHIIYYIYLQYLPEEEIEFDNNLLPENYTDYID